jgi:tripartite ATP-independent transporter DctP family solute receptor
MTVNKALAAVFFMLLSVSAEGKEFRSSDIYPLDSPTVQAVAYMDKLVRAGTGDRHSISMLGQNDSDTESFTVGEVRNGTLDMARVNLAVFNAILPSTVIPALPYLFRSRAHLRHVLDGPIGDRILADLESVGLVGLCFYDSGARSFYSARKPIRRAADMRGMRVRVQQGDITATMVRALGAEPMLMSYQKGYEALRVGVVDAAVNNLKLYATARHYRVAKYYSLTEHSMAPGVLVFSKQVWDTLSEEDRITIRKAAKMSVPYMRKLWDEAEISTRNLVEAAGARFIDDVDGKSFADVLVPLYPRLVPDPVLRDMVAAIQAAD